MVDKSTANALRETASQILAVGDPAQLPPPDGEPGFTRPPLTTLTGIIRQGVGSDIAKVAEGIRLGDGLPSGLRLPSVSTFELCDAHDNLLIDADQVLVGTNRDRHYFTRAIRHELGSEDWCPQRFDKLMIVRNHPAGRVNGEHLEPGDLTDMMLDRIDGDLCVPGKLDGNPVAVYVGHLLACYEESAFDKSPAKKAYSGARQMRPRNSDVVVLDFGWCITAHQAQGSE